MNKTAPSVREHHSHSFHAGNDRRVRKTRQALVQALVQLALEKRYDAITIQDLLDRADVGRSTFYAHYRGKDDLLFKSFERMLEGLDLSMGSVDPKRPRVAPVRELFHHVADARKFHQALARARIVDRQYQAGVAIMSRTIERHLAALPGGADASVPPPVMARGLAGALFALLRWWVENDTPYSPEAMDDMFHSIRFVDSAHDH